jgi:hypothetical protein
MYLFRRRVRWLVLVIPLFVLVLCGAMPMSSSTAPYSRKSRIGIAFVSRVPQGSSYVTQSLSEYHVAPLQAGWYSDWLFNATPAQPADDRLEYVQLINVRQANWPPNWTQVQNAVENNRGAIWIIGNEPEGPFNQGNRTPDQYAQIYREAYTHIKGWDSTARIAIGGVIEPTPMRLHWLESMMAAYKAHYGTDIVVDIWNIHMQILVETETDGAGIPAGITPTASEIAYTQSWSYPDSADATKFQTLVTEFRTWMKNHGQQNKPLIISEMGVLLPSFLLCDEGDETQRQACGNQRIEQFMTQTLAWLQSARDANTGYSEDSNLLVQRWLWFSLNGSFWDEANNPDGFNGSLCDYQTRAPTRFGNRWITIYAPPAHTTYIPLVSK